MSSFEDVKLPPINATLPGQALRALARKLDSGESRSLYVAVVHADGRPDHALYLYPDSAERDMMAMADKMTDACENFAKAKKLGVSTI